MEIKIILLCIFGILIGTTTGLPHDRPLFRSGRQDDSCSPKFFRIQGRGRCVNEARLNEECGGTSEFAASEECDVVSFCCYTRTAVGKKEIADNQNTVEVPANTDSTQNPQPQPVPETEAPPVTETTVKQEEETTTTTVAPPQENPVKQEEETTTTVAPVQENEVKQEEETTTTTTTTAAPETVPDTTSTAAPAPESAPEPAPAPAPEPAPAPAPTREKVLGSACSNNNECPDSGTTCTNTGGKCSCWWDKGFGAAQVWACNTDDECENKFPGHVCRPSTLCRQFNGKSGFCIPTGAL